MGSFFRRIFGAKSENSPTVTPGSQPSESAPSSSASSGVHPSSQAVPSTLTSTNFQVPEEWTEKAMKACEFFENSNDKPQVTGNFDGTGLTCGYMGWTIEFGDQQPLVKKFIIENPGELQKLMPKTWPEYMKAIDGSIAVGMETVKPWSDGSEDVKEPYNSELFALWNDSRMIEIQIEAAKVDMGAYAEKMMTAFCQFFHCDPAFEIYAFYFDVKVLNGDMKSVAMADALKVAPDNGIAMALAWLKSYGGYDKGDNPNNSLIWFQMINGCPDWKKRLLYIGYLRSLLCRDEFKGVCMNRKGIMLMGSGWINGQLYKI